MVNILFAIFTFFLIGTGQAAHQMPSTTTPPVDTTTGLNEMTAIYNELNSVLHSAAYDVSATSTTMLDDMKKYLGNIGKVFKQIKKEEKEKEVQKAEDALKAAFNDVENQINYLYNMVQAEADYEAYIAYRQPIEKVSYAFNVYINDTTDTYNEQSLETTCKANNLLYTLQQINNLFTLQNYSQVYVMAANCQRTNYQQFWNVVMGDITSATTLQEACMGLRNASDPDIESQTNQMNQLDASITYALSLGDSWIANNFYSTAFSYWDTIIQQNLCSDDRESQANNAHASISNRFPWLGWSTFVAKNTGNEDISEVGQASSALASNYSLSGWMEIYENDATCHKNSCNNYWVAMWWTNYNPYAWWWSLYSLLGGTDDHPHGDNDYCCPTRTYENMEGYNSIVAQCLVEAVSNIGKPYGIQGTYAFLVMDGDSSSKIEKYNGFYDHGYGCNFVEMCNRDLQGMVCADNITVV